MTAPFEEYGEILRRALHAEADSVMPAPDGLERIRARIRAPSGGPGRRLGWRWFSESWTRPLLAAGAAAFVAVLAVSAPPAIHSMTSAGDRGPAAHDPPRRGSQGGGTQGGRPNAPYPSAQVTPRPTAVITPTHSPVTGTPSCAPTSLTAKGRTSARVIPGTPTLTSLACPTPLVTPTPTPVPSPPQVSQPASPSVQPQTEEPPPPPP